MSAAQTLVKYGISAQDGTPKEMELMIEFEALRRGGKWNDKKLGPQGLGLFEHFMIVRKLLWPKRWRHKWVDLIYKAIVEHTVTILMGSFSSGKTSIASEFALIYYWMSPHNTMVLVSTTSIDKLKSAVFKEILMLFKSARDRFPWLAGNPLDFKCAITTDKLDEENDIRLMDRGLFGKPCFQGQNYVGLGTYCMAAGEMIDTPSGQMPIENIREGELVFSAIGARKVLKTGNRIAEKLVRIELSDGRTIDCTPEHPFLTSSGWVNAGCLSAKHYVYSPNETMQIMREGISKSSRSGKILQPVLSNETVGKELRLVQEGFYPIGGEGDFLFSCLRSEMEMEPARYCEENGGGKGSGRYWEKSKRDYNGQPKRAGSPTKKTFSIYREASMETLCRGTDSRRGCSSGFVSRNETQFQSDNRGVLEMGEKSTTLQNRSGVAFNPVGRRGGRKISQPRFAKKEGHNPRRVFKGTRVESVKILERDGDPRYDSGENGYRVYNLQVEGHPSFSVNGVVVHNSGIKQERICFVADELQFMAPTFFDCLPNMIGSTTTDANNEPQIKVIGSGNPKHDPYDQLGRAAEPKTGWSSIGLVEKTTSWETGFENGCCVNLIGTDSPNFDVPEDVRIPFPSLVNRSTIKHVATRWGRESLKFNEQCVGRMMIGFAGNRVVTMDLCRKHGAMERAIWAGTNRTPIAAFDPAWTESGDRCIFAWGEFGMSNLGIQILRYGGHMIIPLVGGTQDDPDEQTVSFVKARAKELGIPAQNIFYGSTGRGTTGAACSKIFVTPVPVPIAEGGICSARPVRHDLFIEEEIGNRIVRRLKRCDEEYSKFITEIWFSTRNVIECGQMRELPEETILEGCARQYTTVMGGRIEVESKEEMKETLGFSPDLYDTFGFMVEGARQLGFKIQRLGEDIIVENKHEPDWLELEKEKFRSAMSSAMLSH